MKDILLWIKSKFNLKKLYFTFYSSIAFYPSIISMAMLLLAFLLLYLDARGATYDITEHIQLIITNNPETARSLLSTLSSGMLSLMVFSFTMVMVVLTMASNNYSPRVLPELINTKSHQVVLGIYLGTIGYILIVMINIGSKNYGFDVPTLSVFMSVILVFICFSAFIFFIHRISQNIQISNILAKLYKQTQLSLIHEREHVYVDELPGVSGWQTICSSSGDYFQGIAQNNLLELAMEQDFSLLVVPEVGEFVIQGGPLFKVNKPLSQDLQESLAKHASFYHQEHIQNNFLFGFKHITEVAAKALSPGINDPGTAINALDYLMQLLCNLMNKGNYKVIQDEKGYNRLYYKQVTFEKVFYLCFASIRNYASGDVAVQLKLLQLLDTIEQHDEKQKYKRLIDQERASLISNSEIKLENPADKEILLRSANKVALGLNG